MTTLSDPRVTGPVVNFDEPPVKPPPLLAVGPLAWIRNNLFASWLDTLLTIVAGLAIFAGISSFLIWSITSANWYAVTFNLRLLMLGRYEAEAEWRVHLLLFVTAAIVGIALAAWSRLRRSAIIFVAVILALMFIIPPLIQSTIPLPPAFFAAGSTDITSAATTETPQERLGFIARAGEVVTVEIADQYASGDPSLTSLYSFADNATNLLTGAANTRLGAIRRLEEINTLLAGDLLTANQRAELELEKSRLEVPPPVSETYAINSASINVRLLRGATLEPVMEGTLESGSAPLTAALPEDGWYVLEKIAAEGSDGVTILRTQGIYPLLERSLTTSGGGGPSGGRLLQYVRMTDTFVTEEIRPAPDGQNVPMNILIDNKYRGNKPLPDYLRMFVVPFLNQLNLPLLLVALCVLGGYAAGKAADRLLSPAERPRRASQRMATWLLIALPVLMFILIWGVGGPLPFTDTRRWGGLLLTIILTVFGIVLSFPIGILLALGRRSHLPVISTFCTLYIEFVRGVPFITVLFMAQLLVPLINPSLAEFPNAFRAIIATIFFSAAYLAENVRGGLQSVAHGQEEAAKALGLNGPQITLFITLPQALRAIIPALVGQFISLFKDTSLVAIVGLLDLTGMADNIVGQTEFIGLRRESILFIAIVYFIGSYAMAAVSRRIEESGAGAAMSRKI